MSSSKWDDKHIAYLRAVVEQDVETVRAKEAVYHGAWKRHGGAGVFYQGLVRKWDRIVAMLEQHHMDVFAACEADGAEEGFLDQIDDLRCYLLLVKAEVMARRAQRDATEHEIMGVAGRPPGVPMPLPPPPPTPCPHGFQYAADCMTCTRDH